MLFDANILLVASTFSAHTHINSITKVNEDRASIEIHNPTSTGSEKVGKRFTFDTVFSETTSQRKLYDTCAAPVVQSVLEGYNGTVFAYGQTGAGKTHTMEGEFGDHSLRGIIPNAFQHVFDHMALKNSNETYLIRASYFEIYNEEIRDLLSSTPKVSLDLKESLSSGIEIAGLSSTVVNSFAEIDRVMQIGKKNRSVASTLMNSGSSRSHSVFTVVIECNVKDGLGNDHIRAGKLNLVDLAGSERQAKTGATGERLREATKINLSLSALGNVISALVDSKSRHIPYRDSKLTRILQNSLGGNTKTVMCANVGPAEYNYDETLSTLRYANRAKSIKNKPVINEDPKDTMLREYQEEIVRLKSQLAMITTESNLPEGQKSKIHRIHQHCSHDQKLQEDKMQVARVEDILEVDSDKKLLALQKQQSQTVKERKILEDKLEEESRARAIIEDQRAQLTNKLRGMEAKLMIGGEIASKAAKQEAELRKAEQNLIARKEKELFLARQIEEQEEANLLLNEKYTSLQDEVQSKTRKLKKLWVKYQMSKDEIDDLNSEFQGERSIMIDTIRDLNRQLKLKDLIIAKFIPPKYSKVLNDKGNGGRAVWNESRERWELPRTKRTQRISVEATHKKCLRQHNVAHFDLHLPEQVEHHSKLP